jgi:hypothetical protein
MTRFKLILAPAALTAALSVANVEARAGTMSDVVNKGDLGISLYEAGTTSGDKGDCDCAESLYGSRVTVSGFHNGYGEDVQPVIIVPAAASATAEIINVPVAKAIRKKLKRIASKESASAIRRKAGRTTACVFGAPNASGCRQN